MADRLITNFWFHRKNSNKCLPKDQKSRKINLTKKNISIIIFGKIFKNCREILGLWTMSHHHYDFFGKISGNLEMDIPRTEKPNLVN